MFPWLESALPGMPGAPWLSKAAEEAGVKLTPRAIRVQRSRQAPAFLIGEACPPRPAGPGPAHTNTERKQRSLDSTKRRGTTTALLTERKMTHLTGKLSRKLLIISLLSKNVTLLRAEGGGQQLLHAALQEGAVGLRQVHQAAGAELEEQQQQQQQQRVNKSSSHVNNNTWS
ncbi:hypothetical protein EYF80_025298 [Liparis tanakae]|uniref:Uncharacterized protein n=1 Tax=Liparis tanakae TaxID=230148 RepID=A0A4Z2HEZ8_9TELE|nr:hypothetical protein EYF80_025298 [Liparis tanakae]